MRAIGRGNLVNGHGNRVKTVKSKITKKNHEHHENHEKRENGETSETWNIGNWSNIDRFDYVVETYMIIHSIHDMFCFFGHFSLKVFPLQH